MTPPEGVLRSADTADGWGGRMGEKYASAGDVARLFGRAAFGATAADLDRWTGKLYADVVDHLVDIPPLAQRPAVDDVMRLALERGDTLDGGSRIIFVIEQGQQWWLERMRTTPYPLEERMTLFWHDHFATGPTDKGTTLGALIAQNQLLRKHALGDFRTLCEEITLDPAMLFWLDGAFNTSIAPNENYAREFFELFTLGTIPQVYTEKDIRESAKALTGWTVDPFTRIPLFNEGSHTSGNKKVLGRKIEPGGDGEYKQIVDVALDQKVSPHFIAYKLVLNFAYVPQTRDLLRSPGPLIEKVAKTLRTNEVEPARRRPDDAHGRRVPLRVAGARAADRPSADRARRPRVQGARCRRDGCSGRRRRSRGWDSVRSCRRTSAAGRSARTGCPPRRSSRATTGGSSRSSSTTTRS